MPKMENYHIEGALKSFWQKPAPAASIHKSLDTQPYKEQRFEAVNRAIISSPYLELNQITDK